MATRSKMSLTNELRMLMARLEIPVSGWTCLRTANASANSAHKGKRGYKGDQAANRAS